MPAKKTTPPAKSTRVDPGPIPPGKICTLDGFLREFVEQHNRRRDMPFCFILGAGASRDSGIKTGGEMAADWLKMLHENRDSEKRTCDEWVKSGKLGIDGFDPKNPALHYSHLYELLYKGKRQAGFTYLEKVMEGKEPSFGYSVLAYLLSETHHHIVITTNFDNLVTDALAIHSGTFPIVVNDDSLVDYARANVHRPLVAKIHGSLGLKPKSTEEELELTESWREALAAIFKTHTPIVIGYDGNDRSLMHLLNETLPEKPPEFIWWCYHCKDGEDPLERANEQPPHVRELILKRQGEMVPIPGFDLLMLSLLNRLRKDTGEDPDLVAKLEKRSASRLEAYKKQYGDLGAKLYGDIRKPAKDAAKPTTSPKNPDLTEELALLAKGAGQKQWWEWENEINAESNSDLQEKLYKKAIEAVPNNSGLLGSYAKFLMEAKKDYNASEAYFKRAIEVDPTNGYNLSNYAYFLHYILKKNDEAEFFYKQAIEADPDDAANLGNYANLLTDFHKDHDAAEEFYKRAIEAEPDDSTAICNYATLLSHIRNDQPAAEAFYKRAIEADPKHASAYSCFGQLLIGKGNVKEGLMHLAASWTHEDSSDIKAYTEIAYSAWLASILLGKEKQVWARAFKYGIENSFSRDVWNFDAMLSQAEKSLKPADLKFAKALAEAFLDEGKVAALEKFPRWKRLEPIEPKLVNPDGTVSV